MPPPEIRKASGSRLNPEAKPFSPPNKLLLSRPFLPHQLMTEPPRPCRPLLVYYQPPPYLPYLRPRQAAPVPPPPPALPLMMLRGRRRGSAACGSTTTTRPREVIDPGSSRKTNKNKKQWKPKAEGCNASDVPTASVTRGGADSNYDDDELKAKGWTFTTLMIRNIPNSLKRRDLIEILDGHCRTENQKIMMMGRQCSRSEYDFVYLPIDYWSKANKGYAFVNFTSADGAKRMWRAYHRLKWEDYRNPAYKSHKVCEICPASVQGKDELECFLRKRAFPREEYQPLAAEEASPRDGFNEAPLVPVGFARCSSYRNNQALKKK